ncbi:MAG: Bax inhibitor-1/YccA family protein [Propionibacteriaceae bacterium]|nr:Bax inhibitor-1/YccA family protein [Propionibacteriaceae bacterium]
MRSSNPVLSRPDAWQVEPAQQTQYGQYQGQPNASTPYAQPGQVPGQPYGYTDANAQQFQPQAPVAGRMTIDDVITKTAITLGTVIATAALSYMFLPDSLLMPIWIVSGLVAFGVVMLVSFRRRVNPAFVLAYAAIEGVFLGAVSKVFEYMYPGIVMPAVIGTFVAAGMTLAVYKLFRIRVTSKFRKMVLIGTMAYAGVLLINFVLSFFGMAFIQAGNLTVIALIASAIGVGLAVFNLILDFDFIEQGVAMGAPSSESWRGAFGLTVTMVWLYIELLRLLSYFRR